MHPARMALAATIVATAFAGSAFGQAPAAQAPPQAPPMTSVLAGKKLTPPIKGEALVEFTQPVTKREKDMVVTRVTVRNAAIAPIPRLTVDEIFYDKGGAVVMSGKGTINGLLQPGEIRTIVIETPYNAKMASQNWMFAHANGTVKTKKVPKLDVPKESAAAAPTGGAAAKPAAATKKP